MLMSTASGVWEPDDAKFGVMKGDLLTVRSRGSEWSCFDLRTDPGEYAPKPNGEACRDLTALGANAFSAAMRK